MRSFWLLACLLLSLSAGAAQRVVSLAPSLTDSVLELGAARRLVGVLDGGERPAAIGDLPSVGRYGQVNLERLLELQPDLILVWPGSVPEAQLQRLRDFGIASSSPNRTASTNWPCNWLRWARHWARPRSASGCRPGSAKACGAWPSATGGTSR